MTHPLEEFLVSPAIECQYIRVVCRENMQGKENSAYDSIGFWEIRFM